MRSIVRWKGVRYVGSQVGRVRTEIRSGINERPLAGLRIVIVDDERRQSEALAQLLCEEGAVATSESSPGRARDQLVLDPPDAVILDVGMAELSGTELLAAVRTKHPGLPALLLTGYEGDDPRLSTALDSGSVAYHAKPVDLDRVIELIAEIVDR